MSDTNKPKEPGNSALKAASGGGWIMIISGAVFIAAVIVSTRDAAPDDNSAATGTAASVMASAPSGVSTANAAAEATNIYNNYIAAARLCREGGKKAMRVAQESDVIAGYEAMQLAEQTCGDSADRIMAVETTDAVPEESRDAINSLRSDCTQAHRNLARAYSKVAKLLDQGGGPAQVVATRDFLAESHDQEELCHIHLAEAVQKLGGEVYDEGVAN